MTFLCYRSIQLAILLLALCLESTVAQDEDENKNIWWNENPYMFIYYDLVEYLDDFYDTRANIRKYFTEL